MGSHPKLSIYYDEDDAAESGHTAVYGDPLVVDSLWIEHDDIFRRLTNPIAYECKIAPDASFKANEGGSGSVYIIIPAPTFDAPLIDASADWTGTFFIPYLQTSFDWGGFPGLRHYPEAAERAREELAFLKEGLLPLL
ncbi:hypothetical protein HC928_05820 [bacterium]|nr:hypothetical protein [bacterium]